MLLFKQRSRFLGSAPNFLFSRRVVFLTSSPLPPSLLTQARRWHPLLSPTFAFYSSLFPTSLQPPLIFLLSGLIHEFGLLPLTPELAPSLITLFFSSQLLGVALELGWKKVTGRRVEGWWGFVWVWVWFAWTGRWVVRGWADKGVVRLASEFRTSCRLLGDGETIELTLSPLRLSSSRSAERVLVVEGGLRNFRLARFLIWNRTPSISIIGIRSSHIAVSMVSQKTSILPPAMTPTIRLPAPNASPSTAISPVSISTPRSLLRLVETRAMADAGVKTEGTAT